MVTIKEIAQKAGVSIATVSNILNGKAGASEKTKKRVLEIVKKYNYTPNVAAKNLKQKNTRTIGIITEDITVFCTPEIVDGINQSCEEYNYQFILGNLRFTKKHIIQKEISPSEHKDIAKYVAEELQIMLSKQVDGIIYIAQHCREISCLPSVFPVPIVVAYGYNNTHQCVMTDDEKGAYIVTQSLIDAGHTNVGIICGEDSSIHVQQRLQGYQKALYDNNILFNPDFVEYADWDREKTKDCTAKLLNKGVNAMFVMTDVMAGGVYDYASENNLVVGKDLSVIGFDNEEMCLAYSPQLDSFGMNMSQLGKKAFSLLFAQLDNPDYSAIPKVHKTDGNYVKRGSVFNKAQII